jgi:hypothetical protein
MYPPTDDEQRYDREASDLFDMGKAIAKGEA